MIRKAVRVLTGRPSYAVTVTIGHRPDGKPGVTLAASGRDPWSFDDADLLRRLRGDLDTAIQHLEDSTP